MVGYCEICKIEIREEDGISIHRLPRKKKSKEGWFAFIGHEIAQNSGICSKHFEESAFIYRVHGDNVKRLVKSSACPSILGCSQNTRGNIELTQSINNYKPSRTESDSHLKTDITIKEETQDSMIVDETVINTENSMAIQFKSEIDDSLVITEDDNMEISIILGNKVQESISTEETIINTNLINTQLKREIDNPVMKYDTNMEISVISENEMQDTTSINDTIMNTNSTDIQLKRKTNNSIIKRRNPRYVGDLCREDFTSDETWRLFKDDLVKTRTKIKALNQKIVYLNRKVDRLRKKALKDSLSSDNEDSDNNLETTPKEQHQRKVPKLKNFAEVVVPRWKDKEFKSHFRMSRNTFEFVLSIIAPKLKRHHPGLEMISAEKQFLITIWRMATPDTYKSICEKFNVSRSTAVSTTRRVTKALADLAPMFIKWPVKNDVQEVWAGFEAISAFPKVIGAIDGIYINIPSPRVNPEDYVDKKGHYSVQLQGICDHKFCFTHCYIGHAGSDQRIFLLSEIQDALGKPEKFPDDCYLIGDAAYKLHDSLMTPYRDNGHLTKRQKNYNYCHSSARIAIVKAFGLLKGRFQSLLHYLPMARTDLIDHFILACCVLHNICISHNDDFDIIPLNDEIDNDVTREIDNTQVGMIKRDLICEKLPMRLKI